MLKRDLPPFVQPYVVILLLPSVINLLLVLISVAKFLVANAYNATLINIYQNK